jgi:septum formation protein
MIKTDLPIFLASKSPRRKKLLEQINLKFEVVVVDVDESEREGESPADMVTRLAKEKSEAAAEVIKEGIIITADTTVVFNEGILGKPADEKDAARILGILSGNTHIVYTGYSVFNTKTGERIVDLEKSRVTFIKLSEEDIWDYIRSGSPMDKAGAYGIQDDFGAVFIKEISGCYYNVVGLPLSKVYSSLKRIINC